MKINVDDNIDIVSEPTSLVYDGQAMQAAGYVDTQHPDEVITLTPYMSIVADQAVQEYQQGLCTSESVFSKEFEQWN